MIILLAMAALAAPPMSGGGGAPSGLTTANGTLAQCQALTPAVGDVCYPSDGEHLTLVARSAATWSAVMNGWGSVYLPSTSATGFSWDNQGSATVTQGSILSLYTPASAGVDVHSYIRTAPATPWTFTVMIEVHGGSTRNQGITLRESGTGEIYRFGPGFTVAEGIGVYHAAGPTSAHTVLASGHDASRNQGVYKLRVADDGANLTFTTISRSGTSVQIYTIGRTTHMAAGPDQYGVGIATTTSPAMLDVFSWRME